MGFLVIVALFLASIIMPISGYYLFQGENRRTRKRRGKIAVICNILGFFAVFVMSSILIFTGQVQAQPAAAEGVSDLALAAAFIGAALVTGLGAIGTGIAVSNAAAAAIGAISENENNFGKAMIFVAMAEGIAIYGLLISFMILGRV